MLLSDHVLPYFTAFRKKNSLLFNKAFMQTFPNQFVADLRSAAEEARSQEAHGSATAYGSVE